MEKMFGMDRAPTYEFDVGERVLRGNAQATVIAVSDDKKRYQITADGQNTSQVCWYEIRRADGKTSAVPKSYLAKNRDIKLYYSNVELRSLIHSYYTFGIDTNPDFQRGEDWSLDDKRKLIESIFMNADIGRFLLNERNDAEIDQPIYEIVDGKQRLLTIIDFYEDRFDYNGWTFSMLSKNDARAFLGHTVSVGRLQDASKKTLLKCFLMLNRGGVPVDEEHLKRIELRLACMELE